MKTLAIALLLALLGCSRLVEGETGLVDSIVFLPDEGYRIYWYCDQHDQRLEYIKSPYKPTVKAGNRIVILYTESGQAVRVVRK